MATEECYCEETQLDGEYTCPPCKARQDAEPSEAELYLRAQLHYITGGDFR